jgi:hypothetical protein
MVTVRFLFHRRGIRDKIEHTTVSNVMECIPAEIQVSDLPHVSPSDIMPISKVGIELKRKEQNLGKEISRHKLPI